MARPKKDVAQNLLFWFITLFSRRILKLDKLVALVSEHKCGALLRKCIAYTPMARPFVDLVYYFVLNAMIVWPRGHSLWLVKLPRGPGWLTTDVSDAVGHISVIWRKVIYDKYELKEGQIVIDAGAHIGIYTVRVSKQVGKAGRVVAVEPHPTNFKCLESNLKLNKCTNVIPVKAALASSCGEINLSIDACSVGHSATLARSNEGIPVRATTLDQLIKDCKLPRVDLLKANVEGAMMDVLKGAAETLADYKPKIVTTVNHYPTEREEVANFLSNRGFITSEGNDVLYAEPDSNSPNLVNSTDMSR